MSQKRMMSLGEIARLLREQAELRRIEAGRLVQHAEAYEQAAGRMETADAAADAELAALDEPRSS